MKKVLLFSLSMLSSMLFSQVSYGFEASEGYTLANLSGQNSWGGTTATYIGVVSNEFANPGTQSLKLTGNNGTVHTSAGVISPTNNVMANKVNVTFNAYFTTSATAGDECDFFFSPQSPSESTINGRLRFTWDNKIMVVDYDPASTTTPQGLIYTDTGITFARNTWIAFKIELDFATATTKFYKDNVLIYTGTFIGGTKVGNIAITNDNYNSSAYFDNIKVIDALLSTNELESKITSVIYPNPTTNYINIKTDQKILSVNAVDMSGKKVNVSFKNNVVDVTSLPKGIYLLNIVTPEGTSTQKFIKK